MPPVAPDWLVQVQDLALVPVTALGVYVVIILFTRLNGLRSFSTMSAFDFAITVATGSLLASTILNPRPSLAEGVLGLASLFLLQRVVAFLRRSKRIQRWVDNEPRVLVRRGEVREDNLRRCHMTMDDLRAKVREAGLLRMEDVEAAVMETTGRVSVLARREGTEVDDRLLRNVLP